MRFGLPNSNTPAPIPPTAEGVEVARNVVAKARLIHELQNMPDRSYAVVLIMSPNDEGTMIRATMYPPQCDDIIEHGVYDYAARFLNHRAGNG